MGKRKAKGVTEAKKPPAGSSSVTESESPPRKTRRSAALQSSSTVTPVKEINVEPSRRVTRSRTQDSRTVSPCSSTDSSKRGRRPSASSVCSDTSSASTSYCSTPTSRKKRNRSDVSPHEVNNGSTLSSNSRYPKRTRNSSETPPDNVNYHKSQSQKRNETSEDSPMKRRSLRRLTQAGLDKPGTVEEEDLNGFSGFSASVTPSDQNGLNGTLNRHANGSPVLKIGDNIGKCNNGNKIGEEPCIVINKKKAMLHENGNSSEGCNIQTESNSAQLQVITFETVGNKKTTQVADAAISPVTVPVNLIEEDLVSAAETILAKFSLTDQQMCDILNLLKEVKDGCEKAVIEFLIECLMSNPGCINSMTAPRFNKFLRQLLTHFCQLEMSVKEKYAVCEQALQWAKDRKSVNLRHELELALMNMYCTTGCYEKAKDTASNLYNETKRLQDTEKVVKACLCLSQVYHAMGNITKARGNITTAKTEALKIYTPPDLQAELDLQSGIMQVAEGKDMETAFSYFKEAATGFTIQPMRSKAMKYMLLTKIMVNRCEEGEKCIRSQCHVEDIDTGVEAMLGIASAAMKSSLADFRSVREKFAKDFDDDRVVSSVISDLYTTMLEKNLMKIMAPYQRIQIAYVAEQVGLPREEVERRLSQMVLDGRIKAQLDHRDDCVYLYSNVEDDVVCKNTLETIAQLDRTISHLNKSVQRLLL